jgi:hypothetical protein
MNFTCTGCGQQHDLADLSLAAREPSQWLRLTESERLDSELTRDQCVIRTADETAYFVAAVLDVPVVGRSASFTWSVWVSLSERAFLELSEHWDDANRDRFGPYFGWLCTSLPGYPETVFLKTRVHQRPPGLRPTLELEPTDHPLAIHQREGIPVDQLGAIVQPFFHDQ